MQNTTHAKNPLLTKTKTLSVARQTINSRTVANILIMNTLWLHESLFKKTFFRFCTNVKQWSCVCTGGENTAQLFTSVLQCLNGHTIWYVFFHKNEILLDVICTMQWSGIAKHCSKAKQRFVYLRTNSFWVFLTVNPQIKLGFNQALPCYCHCFGFSEQWISSRGSVLHFLVMLNWNYSFFICCTAIESHESCTC